MRTVSTGDQHHEAQHAALTAAGCEQIFVDKASGKLASWPELSKALLVANRTGDGLVAARARGRTGGQTPKITSRQTKIAREMYEETGPDGRRVHTVEQIAAEFGVTRRTIYRPLLTLSSTPGRP
ncbi:recombinase family protein [Nocardia sp. NPDC049220]|uniref:recombinase family protein n=1 Tax=Nocardia sp. NPDC049220 TaxID=3155273 RepID=UPI0033E992FD